MKSVSGAVVLVLACAGIAVAQPKPKPPKPKKVDHAALAGGLVKEINLLRANPKKYAARLIALRGYFDGKLWNLPGRDPLRTKEGVAALDDAVRALRRAKPMKALARDTAMSRAAADHAADIGPRGVLSHDGTNGSQPFGRMARYGLVIGNGAENIGVAFSDPRLFVIHQLVDDGVADRGHRDNLLTRSFRKIGIACAPHTRYRLVCVMDFADGFEAAIRR